MKWQIHRFDQVHSTNDTAKTFPENSVIVAATQSGGRGRYGRVWSSPVGNLYLSAVVSDMGTKTPLVAFVSGLAVAEALSDFNVRLKWPNDVLLNGGKVAGILLERADNGLIIGIGINVSSAPDKGMLYPVATLNSQISVSDVEQGVLSSLSDNLTLLQKKGFEPIRQKWLEKAVGIGQQIRVGLPNKTLVGVFKNLSPQGELVLETPDKTVHYISAGDVFLI